MMDFDLYDGKVLYEIQEIANNDLVLIVLCGMSGTGKTTFAKRIMSNLQDVKYFAIDDYKDRNYRKFGFRNKEERIVLRDLAISEFKVDVMKEVNKGKCSVIIDYPFEKEWQVFFDFLTKNSPYLYKMVVVDFCKPSGYEDGASGYTEEMSRITFERIWERRIQRDASLETRSASLVSKTYEVYADGSEGFSIDGDKFSDDNKNRLWDKYKRWDFNAITGDFEFSVDPGLSQSVPDDVKYR